MSQRSSGWSPLQIQSSGGRDRRLAACVDRVDDLARIDPLQVSAGRTEVGMPELALDDVNRDPLASELDGVPVAELVLVPTSAQSSLSRPAQYADVEEQVLVRWVIVASRSA